MLCYPSRASATLPRALLPAPSQPQIQYLCAIRQPERLDQLLFLRPALETHQWRARRKEEHTRVLKAQIHHTRHTNKALGQKVVLCGGLVLSAATRWRLGRGSRRADAQSWTTLTCTSLCSHEHVISGVKEHVAMAELPFRQRGCVYVNMLKYVVSSSAGLFLSFCQ